MKKLVIGILSVMLVFAMGCSGKKAVPQNPEIILNISGFAEWEQNISDPKVLRELVDAVVIARISKIEGGNNYNPLEKVYTLITTIGQMEDKQVIAGDLKPGTLPFIRDGGMISAFEYEKGLQDEDPAKKTLAKMSTEEKKNKYVKDFLNDDIELEAGKTYLCYIAYNKDYQRYSIGGYQYGTREYDEKTNTFKNNETGEWEKLDFEKLWAKEELPPPDATKEETPKS